MKIVKRDSYNNGKGIIIAENVLEAEAKLIVRLLNNNLKVSKAYGVPKIYYQVVTDDYQAN